MKLKNIPRLFALALSLLPLIGCISSPIVTENSPDKINIRLAIIGMDNKQDFPFEDVLIAHLSNKEGIEIVERTEIEKILKEQGLEKSNIDNGKIATLLNADGIIFLKTVKGQKGELLTARLSSVKTGINLASIIIPLPINQPEKACNRIEDRFLPLFPKLNVTKANAIPISILNIRAPIQNKDMQMLANQISSLLALNLMKQKEIFVLERWKLSKLDWEKFIAGDNGKFYSGAYLLEGGIEIPKRKENETEITVSILIKKEGNQPIKLQATGKETELYSFISSLSENIIKHLPDKSLTITWDPQKEAAEYYQEADWAYESGLYKEAGSAIENAEILGCKKVKETPLKLKILTCLAYPDPESKSFGTIDYIKDLIDVKQSDSHLQAAIDSLVLFNKEFLPKQIAPGNRSKQDFRLGHRTIYCASRVLRAYYDQKAFLGKEEKLEVLQEKIRNTVKTIDQAIDQAPSDLQNQYYMKKPYRVITHNRERLLELKGQYLPYWYDNIDDSITAFIQEIKQIPKYSKKERAIMQQATDMHHPFPLVTWTQNLTPRQLELKQNKMVETILALKTPDEKIFAPLLKYEFAANASKTDKTTYEDALKFNREFLMGNKRYLIYETSNFGLLQHFITFSQKKPEILSYQLATEVLENCIDQQTELPLNFGHLPFFHVSDKELKKDKAKYIKLGKLFQKYEREVTFSTPSKDHIQALNLAKGDFERKLPELFPKTTLAGLGTIQFSDYWTPYQEFSKTPSGFSISELFSRENLIWVFGSYNNSKDQDQLYIVDIENKKPTQVIPLPPEMGFYTNNTKYTKLADATPDYLIIVNSRKEVFLYNRKDKAWKKLAVPQKYFTSMLLIGNILYLSFSENKWIRMNENGEEYFNSGIIQINIKNEEWKIIASSTRKPAQTIIDNIPTYNVLNIFEINKKIYFNINIETFTNKLFMFDPENNTITEEKTIPKVSLIPTNRIFCHKISQKEVLIPVTMLPRSQKIPLNLDTPKRERLRSIFYKLNDYYCFIQMNSRDLSFKCFKDSDNFKCIPIELSAPTHAEQAKNKHSRVDEMLLGVQGYEDYGVQTQNNVIYYSILHHGFWYIKKDKLLENIKNAFDN